MRCSRVGAGDVVRGGVVVVPARVLVAAVRYDELWGWSTAERRCVAAAEGHLWAVDCRAAASGAGAVTGAFCP